jgi:hypothetical protein
VAQVEEVAEFPVGADQLWSVVGDFGGLLKAIGVPVELQGEGIGQTRTIQMGAEPTVERLESLDPQGRRLSYSIVKASMPFTDYLSTMEVSELDDTRSRLTWTGRFEPTGGEEDAVNLVRMIYQGGIGGLQRHFSG